MKFQSKIFLLCVFFFLSAIAAFSKIVTVRLTGTVREDVEMTIGNTGRTEIISNLPYEFKIDNKELPLTLTFSSENNVYTEIFVPKKPTDDIGHIYLLKGEPLLVNNSNVSPVEPTPGNKIKGIDVTQGVNAAPITSIKADRTFALIIANEEYEMVEDVENANNDGLALKEYCVKTFGMKDSQIIFVSNATVGKLKRAINEIKGIASAYNGDINLIVYYAGHGIPDNASKDAYILPVDADGTDMDVCLSLKKFYNEIDAMNVNQAIVFLDACFSGAQRDGNMVVAARGVAIKAKEEKPQGKTIIFSATSGEETAFSYKEQKHGLFTYFLLKKLQETKGKVKLGDLAEYIMTNVGQQSILINQKKQTPTVAPSDYLGDSWRNFRIYNE